MGTPPNAILAAFLSETYEIEIGFIQWMSLGMPISITLLVFAWFWLTKISFKFDDSSSTDIRHQLQIQLSDLGPVSRGGKTISIIFLITAIAWVARPFLKLLIPGISDTLIALLSVICLFVIPVDRDRRIYPLTWGDTMNIPWGIIILFGSGFSLASLITSSGLSGWIALMMGMMIDAPVVWLIPLIIIMTILVSELIGNTVAAATIIPLISALSYWMNIDPGLLLISVALASSCAFTMPTSTPPNNLIFNTGKLSIKDMAKAGTALNVCAALVISLVIVLGSKYHLLNSVMRLF